MAKHGRRSREDSSRDLGFRGQRLEGLLREELNSLLDGELGDPRLDGIRVSRVELTRDGSSARVWFVTERAGDLAEAGALRAFERATGFIRTRLCDALPIKRSPELHFRKDPLGIAVREQL